MNKQNRDKAISRELAIARHHQRMIRNSARNLCHLLDIRHEGPNSKDVERCAFGRITFEQMLARINARKVTELSGIEVDGEIGKIGD